MAIHTSEDVERFSGGPVAGDAKISAAGIKLVYLRAKKSQVGIDQTGYFIICMQALGGGRESVRRAP